MRSTRWLDLAMQNQKFQDDDVSLIALEQLAEADEAWLYGLTAEERISVLEKLTVRLFAELRRIAPEVASKVLAEAKNAQL